MKKEGYWKRQYRLYSTSWKAMKSKETFFQMGLDLGLLFSLLIFTFFFILALSFFSSDIVPVLQEVAQLEASNPTHDARIAFAAEYEPLLINILWRFLFISIITFLLVGFLYALFKLFAWRRLMKKEFSWSSWWKLGLLTGLSWLFSIILPFFFGSAVIVASLIIIFSSLTLIFLPAFYALDHWKKILKARFLKQYFFVILALVVTWEIVVSIIWLSAFITPWLSILLLFLWLLFFMTFARRYILASIKWVEGKRA